MMWLGRESAFSYQITVKSVWCFRSAADTDSVMWQKKGRKVSAFLNSIPHWFIYLCKLGLIFHWQMGADLFSPCPTGMFQLIFPRFLDQRVPAEPHLPLELQIVVVLGCLRKKSLPQKHTRILSLKKELHQYFHFVYAKDNFAPLKASCTYN